MTEQTFGDFIQDCWSRHDKESETIATQLLERKAEVDSVDKLASWLTITFHTIGGHLGDFKKIASELEVVLESELCKDHDGARRLVCRMLCASAFAENGDHKHWLAEANKGESTEHGATVRAYSLAAANLAVAGRLDQAVTAFQMACDAMPENPEADDPSVKSMAVTSNNIACDLEEKADRSDAETELMLTAAKAARKYWEMAGTWLEIERAEYRLSQSHMHAGQFDQALEHAKNCLDICRENKAEPFEIFFAHEAHVKIHKQICAKLREEVPENMRQWCPEL